MKRTMAILLLATLILMSSLTVFAANQGNGDALQDRQRVQDKTCVNTSLENCFGECTKDMLRTRDRLRTQELLRIQDMLRMQDMLRTRNKLRIMDHLTVQDRLRLNEHIYLHDGTCQIS